MSGKKLFNLQLLLIAPFIGLILGFVFAKFSDLGWIGSSWQIVVQPPVHISSLEAVNQDSLWIRSDSGAIYYNENASKCTADCWHTVDGIPKLPLLDHSLSVTNRPCTRMLPLWGMVATISECRREMWNERNNTFALLNDGTIRLWQVNVHGGEGVDLIIYIVSPIFGAMVLFVLTVILLLFSALIDWLSNKPQLKQASDELLL